MVPRLLALGLMGVGCASVPPRHQPGRAVPEVVLWEFIPVFAADEGPCVVLRPDGWVIGRPGCVGAYVEFEPREEDLERLLAALDSAALASLEPESSLGIDTVENTLQWTREGCRRQVVVDGWLGAPGEPGNPGDRAQTPQPFLAVHDALLSLRPTTVARPYIPARTVIRFFRVQGDAGSRRAKLPAGWPEPSDVAGTPEADLELTLPGEDFQAAVDWVDDSHARGEWLEIDGRLYRPASAFADLQGNLRRLAVPPLSSADPGAGLAPLRAGTCR